MSRDVDDEDISSGFSIDNYFGTDLPEDFKRVPCFGLRVVKDEVWLTNDLKVIKKYKKTAFENVDFNNVSSIGSLLKILKEQGLEALEQQFLAKKKTSVKITKTTTKAKLKTQPKRSSNKK